MMKSDKTTHLRCLSSFLLRWLFAALAGISALGLVRVLSLFFGFTVKINVASIAFAAVFGTPGVVLLLLLRVCFLFV